VLPGDCTKVKTNGKPQKAEMIRSGRK